MTQLDPEALKKREHWATRTETSAYISQMGGYAVARDEQITGSMIGEGPGLLLDMPCGTGRFLPLERSLGFDVVAADYSPTMMRIARQHERLPFVRSDVFQPPFAPESFDRILISRLLFHYDMPERIVESLLPSLKLGGFMLMDTLNPFSTRWVASQLLHRVRRAPDRRLYFTRPEKFARAIESLGLTVTETRSAYFLPTRAYRYLPASACSAFERLEKLTPPRFRVLTYWKARRDA